MAKRRTFEQFMVKCREKLEEKSRGQITHEDEIPDWDWYAAYDDGLTPVEAARGALKAARGF